MSSRRSSLLISTILLACAPCPAAEHVRAEIVADVRAVQPGQPFTVGVLLHIDPGWHLYWINPGDSGLATAVRFQFPVGFDVGPVRFPLPRRFDLPGNVINYGYENHVLLTARVTPPKDVPVGSSIAAAASVKWLCCEKVCIPGKANLQETLPVESRADPANAKLFEEWEQRMPVPAQGDPHVTSAIARLDPSGRATVIIAWKSPPPGVELFPFPNEALSVKDVNIRQEADTSTVTFVLSILEGQKTKSNALPVLVAYDRDGRRRGIEIDVPLEALKQQAKSR